MLVAAAFASSVSVAHAFQASYADPDDVVVDLSQATVTTLGEFRIRLDLGDLVLGRTTGFGIRIVPNSGTWAASPVIGAGRTRVGAGAASWVIDPIADPTGFTTMIVTVAPAALPVGLVVGNALEFAAGELSIQDHDGDAITVTIDLFDPGTATVLLSTEAVLFRSPDQDGDGVSDADEAAAGTDPLDADTDDDGAVDGQDAYPLDDAASIDTDGDGDPNDFNLGCDATCQTSSGLTRDNDDDNDGRQDVVDNCPLVVNVDQADADGDQDGDACDDDDDGDGLSDSDEATAGTDPLDADTDGDNVNDGDDAFPLDLQESVDTDGDGVGDNGDAFPNDPEEQLDSDGDGIGDNAELFEASYATPGSEAVDIDKAVVQTVDEFNVIPKTGSLVVGRTTGFGLRITLDNGTWAASPTIGVGQTAVGDAATTWLIDPIADPTSFTALVVTFAPAAPAVGLNAGTIVSFAAGELSVKDHGLSDINVVIDFFDPVTATVALTAQAVLFSAPDQDRDGVSDADETAAGTDPANPDSDGDGVNDGADTFPLDSQESQDADGDGSGDNGDAFPSDASEQFDADGDGVGDNSDVFPNDPRETVDSDGDGVGDNGDQLPNDPTETVDTDGDGIGNVADTDDDSDGTLDVDDAFPLDNTETTDSDGDGIGDNADPDTAPPAGDLGGDAFCLNKQCALGEGDCDSDAECASGLVCSNDVGANYDFRDIVDVCEIPDVPLPGDLGGDAFCANEQCGTGEGDCDSDAECEDGLVCTNDIGADYGFRDVVDVCEVDPTPALTDLGGDAFCLGKECGIGEGDCDSNSDCMSGLICVSDVGRNYGFRSIVDVCEMPSTPEPDDLGGNAFCAGQLCGEGQGDCDSDAECQTGLVCATDVGIDYGFREIVDVCEAPIETPEPTALGGDSFCLGSQCGVGEGDCDSNSDCMSGLICVSDVGRNYGFRSIVDVCEMPSTPEPDDLGGNAFCAGQLCGEGQGDCDSDAECQTGLVCATDVGIDYGFREIVDVCEAPIETPEPTALGGDSFCLGSQCGVGEGDCDSSAECQAGLVCSTDVGANYGFRSIVDVCEVPTTPEPTALGGNSYCVGALCGAGEGDCDSDSECEAGLTCSNDVGARYGFRSIVDVCEVPVPDSLKLGGNSFCVGERCAAGEGDCDSDSECEDGLVCATDVGADYGYREIVDVCEAPAQ